MKHQRRVPDWVLPQAEIRNRVRTLLREEKWRPQALGLALGFRARPAGDLVDKCVSATDYIGPREQIAASRALLLIAAGRLVPHEIEYFWGNCRRVRQVPLLLTEQNAPAPPRPVLMAKVGREGVRLQWQCAPMDALAKGFKIR